MLMLQKVL